MLVPFERGVLLPSREPEKGRGHEVVRPGFVEKDGPAVVVPRSPVDTVAVVGRRRVEVGNRGRGQTKPENAFGESVGLGAVVEPLAGEILPSPHRGSIPSGSSSIRSPNCALGGCGRKYQGKAQVYSVEVLKAFLMVNGQWIIVNGE